MARGALVAWHARLALRAARVSAPVAAAGGLLLRLLLPVEHAWIAGATAAGSATVALLLALASAEARHGGRLARPRDPMVALESLGTAGQLAQAFARAALVLASFAVGLALGGLPGRA